MKPNQKRLLLWTSLVLVVLVLGGLFRSQWFASRWGKSDGQEAMPPMGCGGEPPVEAQTQQDGVQRASGLRPTPRNDDEDPPRRTPPPTFNKKAWTVLPAGISGPFLMWEGKLLAQRKRGNLHDIVELDPEDGWSVTRKVVLQGRVVQWIPPSEDRPLLLLSQTATSTALWSLSSDDFRLQAVRSFSTGAPHGLSPYTGAQGFAYSSSQLWLYANQTLNPSPLKTKFQGMLRFFCNSSTSCFSLMKDGRILQLSPQWELNDPSSASAVKVTKVSMESASEQLAPTGQSLAKSGGAVLKASEQVSLAMHDEKPGDRVALSHEQKVVWGCSAEKLLSTVIPRTHSVKGVFWQRGNLWVALQSGNASASLVSINENGALRWSHKILLPSPLTRVERHGSRLFAVQGSNVWSHSLAQTTYQSQWGAPSLCD